jgi:aerobic carbon-monoxide dehydrogenase small subunit
LPSGPGVPAHLPLITQTGTRSLRTALKAASQEIDQAIDQEIDRPMPEITLTVNGTPQSLDVPAQALLVDVLRDTLALTGTHIGCDTSQCGACTVHIDGRSAKSCTVLAVQADGTHVTTIEGLQQGATLHPMQEAFRKHHGLQCGFCTPGMIMAAVALVANEPDIDEATVRHGLEGNLCRCTGYQNIVAAVLDGARAMQASGKAGG